MRIGLFGGTFNPIHNGHVLAAKAVCKELCLDKCIWIPSNLPPHKEEENLISAQNRLEMVKLALKEETSFKVDDVELRREGTSYTIDSINYFLEKDPEAEFFLLLGTDAFLLMDSWKKPLEVYQKVHVVVMYRPDQFSWETQMKEIISFLQNKVDAAFCYSTEHRCFFHPIFKTIYIENIPALSISSTEIRQKLTRHEVASSLLHPSVFTYIKEHHLFDPTG